MSINVHINETADSLSHRLGIKSKDLARMLSLFMGHAPPKMGEDIIQEIAITWLEQKPERGTIAYGMARHVVGEAWKRFYTRHRKDAMSLNEVLDDDTGRTHADLLTDGVSYEALILDKLEGSALVAMMPADIRDLAQRKIDGEKVMGWNAKRLRSWGAANSHRILAVT